jgi:hypothetical protein
MEGLMLHVIEQHELLRVRLQVDPLVHPRCARYKHPLRHRMPAQAMLE